MPDVRLISNGRNHVMVTAGGRGSTHWNEMAVTRRCEDAALEDSGTFFFIRDADDSAVWPAARPNPASDREIAVVTTIAEADDDVELRRLRLTNLSSRRRTLSVTSYSEIVLSPAATDSAHPAFSKLFVETGIDEDLGAIFASRRPSAPGDPRPGYFHAAFVNDAQARMSYRTDRMRFIGRGTTVFEAEVLLGEAALPGEAGTVLDAVAALRVPLALDAGASCTVDWFAGIAGSLADCRTLARRFGQAGAAERILAGGGAYRENTLRHIDASEADARVYERLAGAVLHASADMRADAGEIARSERGQSGLWGFGLSGDVPIVLVQLASGEQLELVLQFARAHAFWRAHGIKTELIVVSATREAGQDRLLKQVEEMVSSGGGADQVGKPGSLVADNGHGGFTADLREYVVHHSAAHMTPAPWINVIANAGFGTLISESGSATTWSENAHEFRLTPWSNDPVSDANCEASCIRDEASGRFWSPTLQPVCGTGANVTRDGFGYSVFEHSEDDIESTLRVHVASDAPVKFSALMLRNRSGVVQRLSVTGFLDWVLGDERPKTLMHIVTELDAETGAVFARNACHTDFAGRTALFDVDGDERSVCGDRGDFFGHGGTRAASAAYGCPKVAGEEASLYEHCERAIRHGLRYGALGLPLMGAGDWNDGMNLVGTGGKGESVWLAFLLIAVRERFTPLVTARGNAAFAELCQSEARQLRARVEPTSWDGAWYRRAYFDDGTPLGSAANTECRIDSIAQSWAVLSVAESAERGRAAMESVYRQLAHADKRLVQLLDPAFDTSQPSLGYIDGYVPGVRENGGQYTHAAVLAGLAFAKQGDAERAREPFALLAPIHHGANAADIETYKIEPYVFAGDVYDSRQHVRRGGWSWYTGSAGWMYQWLVESLLGLERRGNQLRVRPLLPMAWPGFEMRYRFGDSSIEIECREAPAGEAARVSLDGVDCADGWVALVDDDTTRRMIVRVCRDAGPALGRFIHRKGESDAACNDRPGSHGGQHGPPPDRQRSRVRRP